jgi:hypothetical protein
MPEGYKVKYPTGAIAGSDGHIYPAMSKEEAETFIRKEARRLRVPQKKFELIQIDAPQIGSSNRFSLVEAVRRLF